VPQQDVKLANWANLLGIL